VILHRSAINLNLQGKAIKSLNALNRKYGYGTVHFASDLGFHFCVGYFWMASITSLAALGSPSWSSIVLTMQFRVIGVIVRRDSKVSLACWRVLGIWQYEGRRELEVA
jgi:hypothetical protein